jgi:hypothetical protein
MTVKAAMKKQTARKWREACERVPTRFWEAVCVGCRIRTDSTAMTAAVELKSGCREKKERGCRKMASQITTARRMRPSCARMPVPAGS